MSSTHVQLLTGQKPLKVTFREGEGNDGTVFCNIWEDGVSTVCLTFTDTHDWARRDAEGKPAVTTTAREHLTAFAKAFVEYILATEPKGDPAQLEIQTLEPPSDPLQAELDASLATARGSAGAVAALLDKHFTGPLVGIIEDRKTA